MENVVEALEMAFGVLIFVLALSITMVMFSNIRSTATAIIDNKDDRQEYIYVDEDEYIDSNGKAIRERTVKVDSIVPTIYRAFNENYIIRFEWKDSDFYLFEIRETRDQNLNGTKNEKYLSNEINFTNLTVPNQEEAKNLLDAIMQGGNYVKNFLIDNSTKYNIEEYLPHGGVAKTRTL